ncbi:MAG TPA: arabinan endo-1,5-alpha-L-arabinosidase, partial [Roseiflexaceae bacterium]|nr:arabinan endo-1,5-alpha-L-arabinosidase [Roseiflexaceae bacterium]
DPAIIRQGQTYYVFSTGDEGGLNHGAIQVRRSTDLAKWELAGTVFSDIPAWIGEAIGRTPPNLWAPDISYFNGKYHLYYAGSSFGSNKSVIGLATNATLDPDSPQYRWIDEGKIIQSVPTDNWNAIDPNIGFDAQGAPWLSFGSFWDGIKMRRIDASTGKIAQDDPKLYSLASRGGDAIEAPSIVYRNGYYYLFVSFDLCCRSLLSTYKIKVGRSTNIAGPYADRDGVGMDRGGGTLLLDSKDRFVGPGGQTVYLDDGVYRMVNHYYDRSNQGIPKLQIHDLDWTSDSWPLVTMP